MNKHIICPNCKKETPDGSNFCAQCGASVAADNIASRHLSLEAMTEFLNEHGLSKDNEKSVVKLELKTDIDEYSFSEIEMRAQLTYSLLERYVAEKLYHLFEKYILKELDRQATDKEGENIVVQMLAFHIWLCWLAVSQVFKSDEKAKHFNECLFLPFADKFSVDKEIFMQYGRYDSSSISNKDMLLKFRIFGEAIARAINEENNKFVIYPFASMVTELLSDRNETLNYSLGVSLEK